MFDVAVIGLGIMGSAAAFEATRRGARVVAFERFRPGHDRGSSHGESRAIRLAHFEGPSYYALAVRAYERWRELERLSGRTILTRTGVLECGPETSVVVEESRQASLAHGLAHEMLGSRAVGERFPAFRLPAGWRAVFQPDGGFLRPELAARAYVQMAAAHGAEIRVETRVLALEPREGAIRVATDRGTVEARAAVVATGPWIAELVPELAPHLALTRQVQLWLRPELPGLFDPDRFPVFLLDDPENLCYGFPDFAGSGVKAASHLSGGALAHADDASRDATDADDEPVRSVLARHIPPLTGVPLVRVETCIYTRTPDEHFVIDRHPGDPRIVVASPCSGHGFKFASAIGEILADLALKSETAHDIARFRLARFD
jgi:sarcosine oxidase